MVNYTPEILAQAKKMFESQKAIQLHKILADTKFKITYKKYSEPLEGVYEEGNITSQKEIAKSLDPIMKTFFGKKTPTLKAIRISKGNYCMFLPLKKRYHVLIDITEQWDVHTGGMLFYQQQTGEAFSVPVSYNTLNIIDAKGLRGFITYANHYAGRNKRLILIGEL